MSSEYVYIPPQTEKYSLLDHAGLFLPIIVVIALLLLVLLYFHRKNKKKSDGYNQVKSSVMSGFIIDQSTSTPVTFRYTSSQVTFSQNNTVEKIALSEIRSITPLQPIVTPWLFITTKYANPYAYFLRVIKQDGSEILFSPTQVNMNRLYNIATIGFWTFRRGEEIYNLLSSETNRYPEFKQFYLGLLSTHPNVVIRSNPDSLTLINPLRSLVPAIAVTIVGISGLIILLQLLTSPN